MRRWAGLVLAACFLGGGSGGRPDLRAEENKDLAELRRRVEQLEKQNQKLLQVIEQMHPGQQSTSGPTYTVPPEAIEGQKKIEKTIDAYMKARDDRLKAEGEKKKEEQEAWVPVGSKPAMRARWNHGLEAVSEDGAFRVHVGGRTQLDWGWGTASDAVMFGPQGVGEIDDGVAFRRARFAIEGTLYEQIDFWMEYDFLNTDRVLDPNDNAFTQDTPVPTDLWVNVKNVPYVGNVKVGNQKPPLSFERLTSSRFLNFLERSYGVDAFINGLDNGFRPGVQIYNSIGEEQRLHYALGVFKNNKSVFGFNVGDGEYDITGRLTALPVYACEGRQLLHVGIGASHRDMDDVRGRYRARTLIRNGPAAEATVLAETRPFGDSETILVPELVAVAGPWTFQSEYLATWVSNARSTVTGPSQGTAFYHACNVEVLYFLTGEHREYNRAMPSFGRVVPHENFFFLDGSCARLLGRGAWQVGLRYCYLDLSDRGFAPAPATLHDVTVGLNWFLNPNMKVQWNYSWAFRDIAAASEGDVNFFGMRFAMDF